jgi:hypothetical protein
MSDSKQVPPATEGRNHPEVTLRQEAARLSCCAQTQIPGMKYWYDYKSPLICLGEGSPFDDLTLWNRLGDLYDYGPRPAPPEEGDSYEESEVCREMVRT